MLGHVRPESTVTLGRNTQPDLLIVAVHLPSAGLDIEPNTNASVLQNIKINSPTSRNFHFGINVYLANLPGANPKTVSTISRITPTTRPTMRASTSAVLR